MKPPFIAIKEVTVVHSNQVLLDRCSLTVHKGEHWAFLGNNNSGSRTLLEAMAGKVQVRRGEILYLPVAEELNLDDQSNHTAGRLSNRTAYVSSRHPFRNLSHTTDFYYQQRFNATETEDAPTVYSYLASIQNLHPSYYWSLQKVINLLWLQQHLDKRLIQLSNGETRRLLLAAAVLKNPALLLLDFPLTGLDLQSRKGFDAITQQITRSGITLIMTTSPAEIPEVITHVAVFEEGRLVQSSERKHFYPAAIPKQEPWTIDQKETDQLLGLHHPAEHKVIISMKEVSIRYGTDTVLQNINWEVLRGEKWALLGPNGAGKSTLISLINGDNPQAYANDILLFDRKRGSGESIWDIKKKTGFVSPELFQYFPGDQSCLQVIESGFYDTMGLFRPSHPQLSALALRWMQLLQITAYAHQLFKQVPVSIQRLCLLARALIKNPPLLLLDEPAQDLDLHQQQFIKQLIEAVCKQKDTTLIYVSHYQEQIPACITHTLLLEKGKISKML